MTPVSRKNERLLVGMAALVIVILFTVFRWQAITFNEEIMVDESMFLADAMRANQFGYTPWHRYDSVTSGPLNTIPVALLLQLGLPANFILLHAFSAFVQALSCIFATILCVRLAGLWPGLAMGLGGAVILAFQQGPDFTHYSSNVLPFLILVTGWLLAVRRENGSDPHLNVAGSVVAGFVFALAPLAKTQASVPAFACWVGLAVWLCFQLWREQRARVALAALGGMCVAGAIPFLLTAASLWSENALGYFWTSFEALRSYAGAPQPARIAKDAVFLLINSQSKVVIGAVLASILATYLVARCAAAPHSRPNTTALFPGLAASAAMLLWFAASCLAISMPANYTVSYEIFLYGPAVLLCAAVIGLWRLRFPSADDRMLAAVCLSAFLAVGATMFGPAFKRNLLPNQPSPAALSMDAEQRTVTALCELGAKSGETLFIWGWAPAVYVHTGMVPATRFSWAQPCTTRFPGYPAFREAMMADLLESKPRFIVDTMQSGYGMNTLGAHIGFYSPDRDLTAQSFYPEIAALGYERVKDIPLANGTQGIIFRLRESDP
jgi:hypothetical protein